MHMRLGSSLFLIAVGAILRFAVSVRTSGFNVHSIGLILMIVGGVGFIISLFWMVSEQDRMRHAPQSSADPDRYREPRASGY
jgi:hypothetical protein